MALMEVVGGIYSPNHYSSRCYRWAHRTVRWCTGHGTVYCLVRPMSADRWGLERLTIEVLWHLVAPDSPVHFDLAVLTSALFTVHPTVQSTVGEVDRCSIGSPDCPVAHRTVR
jgi:hypothetical protein